MDKEGINKSVGMGFTPPSYTVIHSVDKWSTRHDARKYDVEKAKSLMKEAGVSTLDITHLQLDRGDPAWRPPSRPTWPQSDQREAERHAGAGVRTGET